LSGNEAEAHGDAGLRQASVFFLSFGRDLLADPGLNLSLAVDVERVEMKLEQLPLARRIAKLGCTLQRAHASVHPGEGRGELRKIRVEFEQGRQIALLGRGQPFLNRVEHGEKRRRVRHPSRERSRVIQENEELGLLLLLRVRLLHFAARLRDFSGGRVQSVGLGVDRWRHEDCGQRENRTACHAHGSSTSAELLGIGHPAKDSWWRGPRHRVPRTEKIVRGFPLT